MIEDPTQTPLGFEHGNKGASDKRAVLFPGQNARGTWTVREGIMLA